MAKRLCLLLAIALLSPIAHASIAELDTLRTQKLQTAYTYQFLKFVSWKPPLDVDEFGICVFSSNAQLAQQLKTLENKNSIWGKIRVQHFPQPPAITELNACQMAYIDSNYPYRNIKDRLDSQKTLTVVKEGFPSPNDGIFTFLLENKKLRFKINLKQARAKGIQIGSGLLLLATEVIED